MHKIVSVKPQSICMLHNTVNSAQKRNDFVKPTVLTMSMSCKIFKRVQVTKFLEIFSRTGLKMIEIELR